MCLQAHAAAIDGRDDQRPQLEIELVDAGLGHRRHAQLGRQGLVVVRMHQMDEAIVDMFIAIRDAAILAAFSASGVSSGPKMPTTACVVGAWLAASAAAMKLPALCCGVSNCSAARLERLSLMSRA